MAAEAPRVAIGWAAADFALAAVDGATHTLRGLAGPRGTVVAFICNHCPYVKAILPRLIRDARDLAPLGVHVIAINSNDAMAYPEDSFEHMVKLAPILSFPYLFDASQDVARAYDAVCTPDFSASTPASTCATAAGLMRRARRLHPRERRASYSRRCGSWSRPAVDPSDKV